MASSTFTESVVEDAALAWLEGVGWRTAHGPDTAADMPMARLNPALPAEALEDAFRKFTRPGHGRMRPERLGEPLAGHISGRAVK